MSGERLQSEVDYWKGQIEGAPAGLQLVTDYPRGSAPNTKGAHLKVQIEPELTRALKLFTQEHGATLYMVLLAGFQTLLYRYSGQEEVLVAGRRSPHRRKKKRNC